MALFLLDSDVLFMLRGIALQADATAGLAVQVQVSKPTRSSIANRHSFCRGANHAHGYTFIILSHKLQQNHGSSGSSRLRLKWVG